MTFYTGSFPPVIEYQGARSNLMIDDKTAITVLRAEGRGGGEGNSIVFQLSFLTHSAYQYDVTE